MHIVIYYIVHLDLADYFPRVYWSVRFTLQYVWLNLLVWSDALETHTHSHTTATNYTYERLSRYQSGSECTTRANVPIIVSSAKGRFGIDGTRNDVECGEWEGVEIIISKES